jgi:hypothetical protein
MCVRPYYTDRLYSQSESCARDSDWESQKLHCPDPDYKYPTIITKEGCCSFNNGACAKCCNMNDESGWQVVGLDKPLLSQYLNADGNPTPESPWDINNRDGPTNENNIEGFTLNDKNCGGKSMEYMRKRYPQYY